LSTTLILCKEDNCIRQVTNNKIDIGRVKILCYLHHTAESRLDIIQVVKSEERFLSEPGMR
jgi:hypothetical protein